MQRGPSRREVLAGLGALALAACGEEKESGPAEPRIAVIGGGLAGVATAWLLEGWPVDLFEARPVLGGNIRTFEADIAGQAVPIDLGAQYFHPRVYPTYEGLLARLGIVDRENPSESKVFVAPSSVTMTRLSDGEPLFVSPVVPSRLWPLTEPWNRDALQAFQALAEGARTLDAEDTDWTLTVEDWLPTLPVSAELREGLLLPWIAGINSGVIALTRQFSARTATIFLGRALGDGALESTTYSTLHAGMGAVIDRLVAETLDLTVYSGQPVAGIERTSRGLVVVAGGQRRGPYTAVVLANPQSTALLGGLTGLDATRAALAEIETFEATLALHRDPAFAHPDPTYRSLLNAQVGETTCEVSMYMAEALAPLADGSKVDLWKSWVGYRDPADVLTTEKYTHIQYSPATLRAQDKLAALQGEGGIHFAGGWTLPFDAQETALLSAMAVAESLAPESARLAALRGST